MPRAFPKLPSDEARLPDLLGRLGRRAATWGWLGAYERARRGENIPHWHRTMMKLTAAKRRGELRREDNEDE
jgi:hypothetical protein